MFIGDYMLDPPDDPPIASCPECDGDGLVQVLVRDASSGEPNADVRDCPRCDGAGEAHLTDDEVREIREDYEVERAEARRDRAVDRDEARFAW